MEHLRESKERNNWATFSHYVSLLYNCSQVVTWLFVFIYLFPKDLPLLSPKTYMDIAKWKMDHYWDGNDNGGFYFWLWYAQTL